MHYKINLLKSILDILFSQNVVEGSSRVLYSLYGIVEHSGTMRSGHYTAYVKTRATNNQLSDLVLHGKIGQSK